jgi:hypothetical protein
MQIDESCEQFANMESPIHESREPDENVTAKHSIPDERKVGA